MTTLIEQRYGTDCALACIAMALELSWEEVYEAAVKCEAYEADHTKGVSHQDKILVELGLLNDTKWEWSTKKLVGHDRTAIDNGDFRNLDRKWGETCYKFVKMCWGRPAILSVPSLNKEGGSHAVYYDGFEVLDPNPPTRKRYENVPMEELEASDMTVFRPNISELLIKRRLESIPISQRTAQTYR